MKTRFDLEWWWLAQFFSICRRWIPQCWIWYQIWLLHLIRTRSTTSMNDNPCRVFATLASPSNGENYSIFYFQNSLFTNSNSALFSLHETLYTFCYTWKLPKNRWFFLIKMSSMYGNCVFNLMTSDWVIPRITSVQYCGGIASVHVGDSISTAGG